MLENDCGRCLLLYSFHISLLFKYPYLIKKQVYYFYEFLSVISNLKAYSVIYYIATALFEEFTI